VIHFQDGQLACKFANFGIPGPQSSTNVEVVEGKLPYQNSSRSDQPFGEDAGLSQTLRGKKERKGSVFI